MNKTALILDLYWYNSNAPSVGFSEHAHKNIWLRWLSTMGMVETLSIIKGC